MSAPDQEAPLWEYIPTSEFKTPQSTVRQAVQTGIRGFFQRLLQPDEEAKEDIPEMGTLTEEELAVLAPPPDWTAPVPALQEALSSWLEGQAHANSAAFVVGLPECGNEVTLEAFAETLSWRLIQPPEDRAILERDGTWFTQFAVEKGPWVLPALQLCYLRHVGGLWLVRQLLDQVACGRLGRGIIGCDAWAWTYLQHVWGGNRTPAWILHPFGKERLTRWLARLPQDTVDIPTYLDSQTGAAVFPSDTTESDQSGPSKSSHILEDIAHYSRGCPGVALAIWRRLLRGVPDAKGDASSEAATTTQQNRAIWVSPVEQNVPNAISPVARSERALILQTLLLQGALSAETLEQLIPMSLSGTIQALSSLQQMGLLSLDHGHWSVCSHAVPVVRQFLEDKGHLVDAF